MLTVLGLLAIAIFGSAVALVAAVRFGLVGGSPPASIGVREGRLARPSLTPNSVTSQAALWPGHPRQAEAAIEPFELRAGERGEAAIARLAALVEAMPDARVVTRRADYLHAVFHTPRMRFADDFEAMIDPAANVLHVRSASRLGRRDFGVNRQRVEALRAAFTAPSAR
jgi:uncharacterized protein (DUF1499 family)